MSEEPAARLAAAGFIAADDEAAQLSLRAGADSALLETLVQRRLTGEPLAWITGTTVFCGLDLHVAPGVYVPRPHTEVIAGAAAALLPDHGVAVDLCTGCGAVARVLADRRPGARVLGTDIDDRAVACARQNGVHVLAGDLADPLPRELAGKVDVLVAVAPYVPVAELELLQRDTFTFEGRRPYAGGADGLDVVRRVAQTGSTLLRPGGAIVLEIGAGQVCPLRVDLTRLDYIDCHALHDEDGDERGITAILDAPGCKS